jgi:hypothetical protein
MATASRDRASGETAMERTMKTTAVASLAAITFALALNCTALHAHDMADMDAGSSDTGAMGAMGRHLLTSAHMTMTPARPATAADTQRAREILAEMRARLSQFRDYKAAEAAGYEPFMPTVPQEVYHFANRQVTVGEYLGDFDIAHPGSLLYQRSGLDGYRLVGAMYDAPPSYTPDQLDKLIPLSIGTWHAHTNICLPAGVTEQDVIHGRIGAHARPDISSAVDMPHGLSHGAGDALRMRFGYMADPRFGFQGTIATQAECEAIGGNFHSQIFGWMIHVYPFAGDDLKVAFSTEAP